jgi:hypothetical protein
MARGKPPIGVFRWATDIRSFMFMLRANRIAAAGREIIVKG